MMLSKTNQLIGRARSREFLFRLGHSLSYGLPAVGVVGFVAAIGYSFALVGGGALLVTILIAASAALIGSIVFGALGASTAKVVRLVDRRADLKDRLTNALEFSDRESRNPLMELAIVDAEEAAERTDAAPLTPVWQRSNWKRLATLALLVPLAYGLAVVQLAQWIGEKQPDFLGAIAPTMPAELAEDGFRDLPDTPSLLPAITGFRGVMGDWRERLTELRERARKLAQQRPQQEPELPETIYREDLAGKQRSKKPQILAVDGLPAVRETSQLHLSDMRALGDVDGEVDSSMQTAFSQLDQTLLDQDPNLEAVQAYLDQLENASQKGQAAGQLQGMQAGMGMMGPDGSEMGALRNATQGAQQEIFNEFLEQYAQHLGRAVNAKRDINEKRNVKPGQTGDKIKVSDQPQEVPENAELRMVKVTDEMKQGVKLDGQMGEQITPGGDPMKAGQGGGTFRGAIKIKHETETAAGQKQTVKGQIGEGRTTMQILEDVDEEDRAAYSELLAQYRKDATERLADPTIPAAVRAFVQRYLQSIGSETK
jgi:hypothetical protein